MVYGNKINVPVLVAVPALLVTLILPLVAVPGTTILIELSEIIVVGGPALTPLNFTSVTLERFVPVIVINTPALLLMGVNDEIVGGVPTRQRFSSLSFTGAWPE